MSIRKPRYLLTFIGIVVVALSFVIVALVSAGVVSNGGAWRALMIPAYLPMLASAVLATALSVPNNPVFLLVAIVLLILPMSAVDWLLSRRHRDAPAA
jgi:hypothetical protein